MVSESRVGTITHPLGNYLREGPGDGTLYRVQRGQVAELKRQIDEAGGMSSLFPSVDIEARGLALDSLSVYFEPSGELDRFNIPYATNLRLRGPILERK